MRQFSLTRFLLLVLFFGTMSISSRAQIVAWNNNALTGTTAGSLNATTNNVNLNTSVLSRGAGIVASSLTGGYASNTWTDVNVAGAITNNRYYQCVISSTTNYLVSLSTLDSKLRRSSTGPNAYIWRYSTDGTNFTDIGTAVSFTTATTSGDVQPQISLSGIAALQNVASGTTITLRLYAWGASGAGGTLAFGTGNVNSLAFGGTVISSISSNADLSNLTLSAGTLTPAFASATISYTASVSNAVSSITATPTTSDAGATVTVNGNTVTSGSPSGAIALAVGPNVITTVVTAQDAVTTKTYTVTVTRAAAGTPLLVATSPLTDFGSVCINTTVGPNSFTLDGTDLDGSNIDIAALPGFTYSETAGGTYTTTLSFTYTAPGFTGKQIYVKFNPTAVQSYNGNITLSGGGVASFTLAAAGSGVNTPPSATTGGSSAITATSGSAAGTISATGCSAVTSYGIEYSTSSGFPDGAGTQVAGSNLSAGNFSVNLTSLAPNTRYYYKAYASNGTVTGYGTQQAFTCLPLPVPMTIQPGLSYTENFADMANWTNFFIGGTGANHFSGLSAAGSGGIPNGTTITASTQSFVAGNPGTSGGVQRGTDQIVPTQSIVLLSTGSSPENSTSAAIDFYMDFTGVNAGTVSFDWASVNNQTGDRNGSMRVYTSTDGITFTELTFASVLNFTNNSPTSGTQANIALPASFNNSATARLRFYYSNGTGGTTGSRPKISIDNLKVTAVATTPCVSPSTPATTLVFGTITDVSIAGSFTAASPATDGYMVVMSTSSSLTGNPVDGVIYNIGDNVGDGSVVANGNATSFTATGLNPLTTYYFFIFPVNSVCTGGPLYYTASVLNGSATTIAGLPPCAAPAAQATSLVFGTTNSNSIQGSFTATAADEYLVLRSTSATLSNNPVNTTIYNAGDILGNATVVQRGAGTSFTATGLLPNTQYYFFVFSINSQACINGPVYNTVSPLNGTQTTLPLPACTTPAAQPTTLILTPANTTIAGTFTGVPSADDYLVVINTTATLSASPVDNVDYNAGDNLGGGTVVANSANTSFLASGLTPGTAYYFFVFAANKNCSGGTKYATGGSLTGNATTTNAPANNYFFGTLHSHSDYSDGNKDHPGYTPADDYTYAATALCMDYLGIAEHNHFSSVDNPGNSITNFHLGASQATTFTNAHPNFLALYGMEWGVISGGGHVLVYGDGMDNLWGWESGSGGWGPTNNYDVYVAKNDYTGASGLFKTVNDNAVTNTFASLAHPSLGDFNNVDGLAYNAAADNAITAVAVESGPAFSTNITYSNPGPSMSFLWYYQKLLSKGYHLGPTIDHDNHNTTFGHTTTSRTAIIAPSLTKTALITALRNMNFYATQDCDTKVDFTINTKIMGSTVTDRFGPTIAVTLTDATTSISTAVIRLMYGVPGSGVLPVKIDSVIGSSLTYTDNSLANNGTGYYYLDIVNGSSRIVTSPIWYTRNDAAGGPLPVSLNNFLVQKADNIARISWSTEQEINSSHFVVERSVDGRTWNSIATVAAAGISTRHLDYITYDNAPLKGINYYRLKQVDINGKTDYSVVKTALFNSHNIAEVAPNPAKDVINLYINKTSNKASTIQVLNASGSVVYSTTSSQSHVPINTTSFGKGLYFVKVINAEEVTTIRVLVQ